MSEKNPDTASLRYTLLIGLGFMTTGISWSMYNTYVPIMLEKTWFVRDSLYFALPGLFIIGVIMTFDNVIAWFIQPWIGAKSDNTWFEKWGRRMPYLLIGIPLSAVAFVGIPIVWWLFPGAEFPNAVGLLALLLFMLTINIFNVFMAFYRSPVVALMPDLIPPEDRTKANGAINLMGGLGSVIAFFAGKFIVGLGRSIGEPQGLGDQIGFIFGFAATALVMVVVLVILKLTIIESKTPFGRELEEKVNLTDSFREVFGSKDRSGVFILLAIFLWFTGYQAMETFFSLYGVYTLGFADVEDAVFYLNAFAIPFLIFAIPGGLIANKIGRSKTIRIGLIGVLVALLPLALLPMRIIAQNSLSTALLILIICLIIGGSFWALVNINSIVIVWEIGGEKRGAYTGLYYFFATLAAVIGPPLVGGLLYVFAGIFSTEITDGLFAISWLALALAFVVMFGVKSGELGQKLKDSDEKQEPTQLTSE
ncbi:MAG: MFS transporter [Candidatus Hodarchaeota archaeon]